MEANSQFRRIATDEAKLPAIVISCEDEAKVREKRTGHKETAKEAP